jgi:hypothetical protein
LSATFLKLAYGFRNLAKLLIGKNITLGIVAWTHGNTQFSVNMVPCCVFFLPPNGILY